MVFDHGTCMTHEHTCTNRHVNVGESTHDSQGEQIHSYANEPTLKWVLFWEAVCISDKDPILLLAERFMRTFRRAQGVVTHV